MAIFSIGGTDLHLGGEVRRHIDGFYAAKKKPVPESLVDPMILYALSLAAEALHRPNGLFATEDVEVPFESLPTSAGDKATLRGQILTHLRSRKFRPALHIQRCPVERDLALYGMFGGKDVSLSYLGPVTLAATSAAAIRQLGLPPLERIKMFSGSDNAQARPEWELLHKRHVALRNEHLAKGRRHTGVKEKVHA
jgi:hypothetical protein